MITVKKNRNGYIFILGCMDCDKASYLWWKNEIGNWVIDDGASGVVGPDAKFCPNCGIQLPNMSSVLLDTEDGSD